jgi:hypothetical protein
VDEDERCFYYRGFLLMCDPTPKEGGGYRANAVVIRRGDPGGGFVAESPEGVHLISEEAAVEYAKAWAVAWVDTHSDAAH